MYLKLSVLELEKAVEKYIDCSPEISIFGDKDYENK